MERGKANLDGLIAMAAARIYPHINVDIGEAILQYDLAAEAISLAGHGDPHIAFRVSWGLEYAYFKDNKSLRLLSAQLVDAYINSRYDSTRRIYGKIVDDLLRRGDGTAYLRSEPIAEKAFDLLVSPDVNVAPKVWAMEILCTLHDRIDWIAENLVPTMEHQTILNPTPAMISHSAKCLRRLRQK